MAKASVELITALREAAQQLRSGARYSWGHHGACNCGHLLQSLTSWTEGDILRYAHTGIGEWTELAVEYCGTTQAPVGMVIDRLEQAGLNPVDIKHVEYLTDREVLSRLPGGFRWLKRNNREDVILYFETFADLLEEKLATSLDLDLNELMQRIPAVQVS